MKKIVWYLSVCISIIIAIYLFGKAIDVDLAQSGSRVENMSGGFAGLLFIKMIVKMIAFYYLMILGALSGIFLYKKKMYPVSVSRISGYEKGIFGIFTIASIFYLFILCMMIKNQNGYGVSAMILFFGANVGSFVLYDNIYKAYRDEKFKPY